MDGHVAHTAGHQAIGQPPAWPWVILLLAFASLYAVALVRQPAGKSWSRWRIASWYAGLAVAGAAMIGPLADAAHTDFSAHMVGHLLLGMLVPMLLVHGAPVTLALRALPVVQARRVVRVLASAPLRMLSHPVTASVLTIGGLVALYRTDLYNLMHGHTAIHLLVHLHLLMAGYLFAAAMIGIDPIAHRPSHRFRLAMLVLALGAHAILAKSLYASPPAGVPADQAEAGSKLMYYGGDVIDLLLIVVFCWQWYRATAPGSRGCAPGSPAPIVATPRGGVT